MRAGRHWYWEKPTTWSYSSFSFFDSVVLFLFLDIIPSHIYVYIVCVCVCVSYIEAGVLASSQRERGKLYRAGADRIRAAGWGVKRRTQKGFSFSFGRFVPWAGARNCFVRNQYRERETEKAEQLYLYIRCCGILYSTLFFFFVFLPSLLFSIRSHCLCYNRLPSAALASIPDQSHARLRISRQNAARAPMASSLIEAATSPRQRDNNQREYYDEKKSWWRRRPGQKQKQTLEESVTLWNSKDGHDVPNVYSILSITFVCFVFFVFLFLFF